MQHLASTMEEHLVRVHSDIYFLYVKSWYGGVKLESICIPDLCALCSIFYFYLFFGGQHNPFQDKSTSCLPQVQSHWCLTIHNDSLLYFVSQSTTCSCTKLMKSKQLWNYVMIWHHSVRSRWVCSQRSFLGHVWPSELTMHEIRGWNMMWTMQLEVTHAPELTFDLKHTHCDLSAWGHQWRSQMGSGGRLPPGRNSAPSCPPWNHTLYSGLWWVAFWVPVSPPHPSPPCRPLILKSGYAPGCHTVTPYNFKAVLIFIDLAQLHFCLAHKNSHPSHFWSSYISEFASGGRQDVNLSR